MLSRVIAKNVEDVFLRHRVLKKHQYQRHFQGCHDIIKVCKKQTLQN